MVRDRLIALSMPPSATDMPLSASAQRVVDAAREAAETRRRSRVNSLHLMHALLENAPDTVADVLVAAGGSVARLREEIAKSL